MPTAGVRDDAGGAPDRGRPTPLVPVLAFTFLNSIGSAVVYSGLFSLAKFHYGFERGDNYLLALVYGVTYIPAAMLVGRLLRALSARSARLSPRAALLGTMLAMGVLSWVPWIVAATEGAGPRASWPVWMVCAGYSPLSGMLWPMVEAYVAGGRKGAALRGAIGKFNIAWSSALVVTLLAMAPLVEHHALLVLQILGCVHIATAACLWWFLPAPGEHVHEPELPASGVVEGHVHCPHCGGDLRGARTTAACSRCGHPVSDAFHLPHPPVYPRLLAALQLMLPVAFLGISTISPYLTIAFERLGVAPALETPLIAVWMSARVAMFAIMERWHRWHGRWWAPIGGIALVLGSLATVVLSPFVGGASMGLPLLIVGLVGFGAGIGTVYASTLYYTMEVGTSQVDAGGVFETLIGVGYSLGPMCGLLGTAAIRWGGASAAGGNWVMLAGVGTLAAIGLWWAARRALAPRSCLPGPAGASPTDPTR